MGGLFLDLSVHIKASAVGMHMVLCGIWKWMFRPARTQKKKKAESVYSFPEFEFQPAADFVRQLGCAPKFVIANPLDLILQQRGLMADCVVVEMKVGVHQTALWLRFNTEDLASRGMAECTLFADDSDRVFDGVCGFIVEKKKI